MASWADLERISYDLSMFGEAAYDPYYEQDLQPWERRWEERYASDPESEEAA